MPKSTKPSAIPDDLDLDADPGYSMDRLVSLGDGIFAFAMTLLAINVDIPRLAADATSQQVTESLFKLIPEVIIFATSFLLVATYWQVNRRTFHYIIKSDTALSWLFILQLMFVAFLPVATGLFDTYPEVTSVIVVYAGTLTVIGVVGQLMFSHARRSKLIDPGTSEIQLDYFSFRGIFTILIYFLVILAAVVAAPVARYILFVFLLGYPFLKYFFKLWYNFRHRSDPA